MNNQEMIEEWLKNNKPKLCDTNNEETARIFRDTVDIDFNGKIKGRKHTTKQKLRGASER